MKKLPLLLALAVIGFAPAARGQMMAGKYSFQAGIDNGQSIPGELELTGTAPGYGGWIRWMGGQGPDSARISQVSQQGAAYTIIGDNQTGRWTIHITFVADSFSGTYDGPA